MRSWPSCRATTSPTWRRAPPRRFPRWGAADAGQLRLHRVQHEVGGEAPSPDDEMKALAGAALFPAASLQAAGVRAGALLLARVPAPPRAAAAPAPAGTS